MAQALVETIFDVCYLLFVMVMGFFLISKSGKNLLIKKFGFMAVLLGFGDSFHLIPRIYALWTTGLEANAVALGIGKFVASITMTIFYLLLYYVWREHYNIKGRQKLTMIIWILAITRIVLCLFPQNQWLSYRQPLLWGIIRNIPFLIMGIIIIILFAQEARKANDKVFRYMWLAVALSFAFYIPVVLAAPQIPLLGMLMIPKTLAYVWVVYMGWKLYHQA